ncbi:DUF397 domain-containing protein [Streptomyces sp. NPDC023723]|uniref:DUF397 domain-containing protein n=1 Tax=Streptomyces sp. NPDC023723 TaxID=3154323 RepID=UPI0033FE8FD0
MPAETPHHPEPDWFKSSYSGGNATECLEAAFVSPEVLIRDSKQRDGARVRVSASAWGYFVTARAAADL